MSDTITGNVDIIHITQSYDTLKTYYTKAGDMQAAARHGKEILHLPVNTDPKSEEQNHTE